jgi:predicted GIY-YIG superfamily endonuclease
MAKNHRTPQFVYILRCSNSSYYVGITENVSSRLARHNSGNGSVHTRLQRPVTLVHQEGPYPIAQAIHCERRRRRSTGLAVSKPYSGIGGRFGHKMAGGFLSAGDGEV